MRLDRHIRRIAREPVLLVACDFDGTLAGIAPTPDEARPRADAMVALRALVSLPRTHVAVISGRALADLERLARFPAEVHLVGSHGGEGLATGAPPLASAATERLVHIIRELNRIAMADEGFLVERKPTSVAFHYRNASPEAAARALDAIREGPAAIDGVTVRAGRKVIELAVTTADKGAALHALRDALGASAVVYVGDDVTDEDAFRSLGAADLGIKVGEGETAAGVRIEDTRDVGNVLAEIFEHRLDWLESADVVPIEKHAMLSDQRTFALATPAARIVWLCVPRLDSPALFCELLGGPAAGYFAVRPADDRPPISQRYVDETLVLETHWEDLRVTDWIDCSDGRPCLAAGHTNLIRVIEGSGRVRIEFAPRLDFGRVPTLLVLRDGCVAVTGWHDPIVMRSTGIDWQIEVDGDDHTAWAEIELGRRPVVLDLAFGDAATGPPEAAAERLAGSLAWWRAGIRSLTLPGVEADAVRRSALLLIGLCYEPTGAIAAAATTSLPEHLGGIRNWDYRYCWIRDGALTAQALLDLGRTREADRFLGWLGEILDEAGSADRLRPVYTVTGGPVPAEASIVELIGYRGSRPVRIGNAAAEQFQLDVFGPVVELAARLAHADPRLAAGHEAIIRQSVDAVATRWREPDHGIWEVRGPRRHYVHSKTMCWLAVDRALAFFEAIGGEPDEAWRTLRDEIARDIIDNGYVESAGAFCSAYDGDDLDAAALHVGLSGLIDPMDPRFVGTVEAVERHLLRGSVVQRYFSDDRLPGLEGGFNLCTAWLIRSLVLIGRTDDAHALFDRMLALAGPTGLIAEEWDPLTGDSLGNVPQAYSHIGVIDCAFALDHTRMR